MTVTSHQNALAPGTELMEYRLTGLLGAGAFGITYLARDTHLDKDVAIKEYLPSAFATRAADSSVVPIAS
jgi:serine/threonine protein kinase